MHYKNCTSSLSKNPGQRGSSSKASKSMSPCYLIMFQRVWHQNLSSKSTQLSCTSIKKSVCGNNLRLNLAFKVPERWAPRLKRVAISPGKWALPWKNRLKPCASLIIETTRFSILRVSVQLTVGYIKDQFNAKRRNLGPNPSFHQLDT